MFIYYLICEKNVDNTERYDNFLNIFWIKLNSCSKKMDKEIQNEYEGLLWG